MIKYKSYIQRHQFRSIRMCPWVFQKVHRLALEAEEYGIDLLITSVFRKDSKAHGQWRAVDIRVRWAGKRVIPIKIVARLRKFHNRFLQRFGAYDSFFEHNVGRGPHCHCQRPEGEISLTY